MRSLSAIRGDWGHKAGTDDGDGNGDGDDAYFLLAGLGYATPVLKIVAALALVWLAGSSTKVPRLSTGLLTSAVATFTTYTYLLPLFLTTTGQSSVATPFDAVALGVVSVHAALVGLALGTLLPGFFRGATFGAAASLVVFYELGDVFGDAVGYDVLGGTAALVCGLASARFGIPIFLPLSAVIVAGAVAAELATPGFSSVLRNAALGYDPTPLFDETSAGGFFSFINNHAWILASTLVAASVVYKDPRVLKAAEPNQFVISDYEDDDETLKPKTDVTPSPDFHERGSPSPDSFNMFDPAFLPLRLQEYANMTYQACEDLGNFFGFQDSSVRNQAEHLLVLLSNNRRYMSGHILPPALQPPSPIHALHAKVFSNYMKWCRAMGIRPNFSKTTDRTVSAQAPPTVASRVVDLVLFFCVWGEACNIRHMPECLWFLYHKMMEEYAMSNDEEDRSLYAGHFLDKVVTPIFKIVQQNMKSGKTDHVSKRNYDDFNEFFWDRECLQYRYTAWRPDQADVEADSTMGAYNAYGALPGEVQPCITDGFLKAPKTFLEKRSWLRGIMAMSRIVEWHFVTFYLLAVLAFSHDLVWGWVYSLKVASGVFWMFNSIAIVWGLLEVWSSYPGIHLSGPAIFGSVFVLVARFLILVYQTLYLMWTFGPATGSYLGIEADAGFWWWQYIWLSLLCMVPYFLEAITNLCPSITTSLFTSRNEYVQTFFHILFPISRLYVGKEVHESFRHTAVYTFFWATLITWKLYFSYVFEVYSMVLPTIEIADDFVNYPDQSFFKMSLLLVLRWLPQFIVYCIDMSIWYAVWQAFAGTSVGFSDHLGDIRSMKDIRDNFGSAPEHFCRKMLSPDAGSRRGSSSSFAGLSQNSLDNNNAKKRHSFVNPNSAEGQSLLGSDPHKLQGYVNRLLDVRIQKWVMFSAVWNEIIDHFREEDLVSNRERDYLKFSRFDGFSQAIYLPVFQTAGVVDETVGLLERPIDNDGGDITDSELFQPILENVTMRTAVSEVWELGNYVLLKLLGSVHDNEIQTVMSFFLKWVESGEVVDHMEVAKIRGVVQSLVGLVNVLSKGVGRRKPASKRRSTGAPKKKVKEAGPPARGIRRSISASTLNADPEKSAEAVEVVIHDALRDNTRDKARAFINSVKNLVGADSDSRDVSGKLTFVLKREDGFFWDDAYASDALDDAARDDTFKKVLTKLQGLVACHPDEVEPKSKEVHRRLTFFVNSLFMDIPNAPSIHDMFSWNVLTPYYKETVTLTKGELETRTDALGVSTLLYLQTLYKADWANFLERVGLKDEEKVWSKDVMKETRQWASIRAQTLNRTVSGMMYYEKALRLLANLERLDDQTTNDLMGEKFGYIVSCQVYGAMKKDQDPKADDIDDLMHRFPHLRIAYIDSVRFFETIGKQRAEKTAFYSCLVKSDGNGKIQEVYRVRLPGNPILGEGKPENQNHAMIFSRGEFVQTIDMNQEGYFEEALKMRNALQEFAKRDGPMPTTILGLREHIFTGSVSSLANYMALQETSFVTLGQRVLTKPLCIRLHYGHPDVFDKLFFITRGGISKSSKGINLSEDIFAGYNNAIRGGQVAFKEYLQVGKGRDVGMSQIYQFEAKLSQGAGEQSLSRDVYRLCHRLDFARLLSYYYGGIGHYFSNVLTVNTVYIVVYLTAILALYDIERIGDRMITPAGTIQMLLGGLGLLQTIPLFCTLGVERGWWASFVELVQVFLTGGPLHFMFHIQTKANYMTQTILVGGAKYRPTGRGFVTQHTPMDEQYRFFASSHLYLGVELGAGLIIMFIYTEAGQYFGRTWSLWLASLSFIASPFWFNPLTFEWNIVTSDYVKFIMWMRGKTGGAARSWSIWWTEENSYYSKMAVTSKAWLVIKAILYFTFADGIARSDLLRTDTTLNKPIVGVTQIIILIVILMLLSKLLTATERSLPYPVRRTFGILIAVGMAVGCCTIFIEDINFFRYGLAAYYGVGALCQLGLICGVKAVKNFYFVHDLVCGHIIFIPLFVLAILQVPHLIQTWLLYHNALSTDVVVSNILRYARKSQESGSNAGAAPNDDLVEQISELRKLVQKQEQVIENMSAGNTFGQTSNPSSDAIASLVQPAGEPMNIQVNPSVGSYVRPAMGSKTLSTSTLDVWGEMALGNSDQVEGDYGYQSRTGQVPTTSGGSGGLSDFTFSQPDVMPPR